MASRTERAERGSAEEPVPSDARWRFRDTLLLAVGAGVAFGLVEVSALGWRRTMLGLLTHVTPHVTWMAPVGYAALFLLLCPMLLLTSAFRFGRGPALPLAAFATLGLIGWLEMAPWGLHPLAICLLAVGVAVRLGSLAATRVGRLRRLVRIGAPALSIPVVFGAVQAFTGEARLGPAPSSGTAGPGDPNVLLLVLDTVRAKSLGLYGGDPAVSPRIDALAAESIVFDRAISTAPWTLPSHASMFTGRWPHELSVGWVNGLDESEPTLAAALAARGYRTAGFVANLIYTPRLFGLARGFQHYEDFPMTAGQIVLATSLGRAVSTANPLRAWLGNHELLNRKSAARLNGDLLEWLDRSAGRPNEPAGSTAVGPFFVFVNYFDAHEPYEPPEPFRSRFAAGFERRRVHHQHDLLGGVQARRIAKWAMWGPETAGELALYEASIASLDSEVGALLDSLEARTLLDSTLIIITSDHGEQFGEHGLYDHLQSLYQPLTHVPLLLRLPGARQGGKRVARPVSLIDISATVLDLVDAGAEGWPGRSLRGTWSPGGDDEGSPSPALSHLARGLAEEDWYPIARGEEMYGVVRGNWHYICNPDLRQELYDLATDPEERRNLVGAPGSDSVLVSLEERAASDPDALGMVPCLGNEVGNPGVTGAAGSGRAGSEVPARPR